jgi:hypothetical protein
MQLYRSDEKAGRKKLFDMLRELIGVRIAIASNIAQ